MTKASRFIGTAIDQKWAAREAGRIDRVAATILAGDHGTIHRPGDRMDLCPRCSPDVDARLLSGRANVPPRRPRPASSKALKVREVKAPKAIKPPKAAKPPKAPKAVKAPSGRPPGRPCETPGHPLVFMFELKISEAMRTQIRERAESQGQRVSAWARSVLAAAIKGEA